MIAFIRGRVAAADLESLVLDVGGVGLAVTVPPGAVSGLAVGDEVLIHTSLVVREDSWTLYGFTDPQQRADFETCQGVPGVGPKVALAIVATLTPRELRRAIDRSDLAALTRVPGVGRKGAARLVVELGGRLAPVVGGPEPGSATGESDAGPATWRESVTAGLVSLGWGQREVEAAVDAIAEEAAGGADVATLLRAALQVLRGPA